MNCRVIVVTALTICASWVHGAQRDLDQLEEQAWREAVEAVASSVVRIQTVGGLDRLGKTIVAHGPTTGLIVSPDGYIVSSLFNFVGRPSSILVHLPSGEQTAADLIARDKSRMLALLKVETEEPLPVPKAARIDQLSGRPMVYCGWQDLRCQARRCFGRNYQRVKSNARSCRAD